MTARAVMVLGTSSHAGKSLLTTALCRIFAQHGYRVAPFKSQNMSLNSAATAEGLEIGRAQALQAEAAGIAPSVDMNPILLKPAGNMSSQIVVRGRIWGQLSASAYHRDRVEELMPVVRESYAKLAAENDVIVLEGAGSPAEINLKERDIANMRAAEMADAACLLVGDIDRGGVFASLLGTLELLEPRERARVRGFVINKFRGDLDLLTPGVRMMEDRLRRPCLGVVPYLEDLALEEEDSLGAPPSGVTNDEVWLSGDGSRRLRIAVIAVPSFSNFTDFDALRAEPSVAVRFFRSPHGLHQADVIVLPGSKQTVDDLQWMRAAGIADEVAEYARTGLVVGICGGMQMLGREILDPEGVERTGGANGLGLLPLRTAMRSSKITSPGRGRTMAAVLFGQRLEETELSGYEIHVGETLYAHEARPFASLDRGSAWQSGPAVDGCINEDGRILGTYLHGIFDGDTFRHRFIAAARSFHRLSPAQDFHGWQAGRERSLEALAEAVRASLDLRQIFAWVGLPAPSMERCG